MFTLFVYLIYLQDIKHIPKENLAVPLKERLSLSLPFDIICLIAPFIK